MLCPFENDIKVIYGIIKTSHYIILGVCVFFRPSYKHRCDIQQPLNHIAALLLIQTMVVWLLLYGRRHDNVHLYLVCMTEDRLDSHSSIFLKTSPERLDDVQTKLNN